MAAPGIFTIDSVTAGVESLIVAWTPTAPLTTDRTYLSYKKSTDSAWITLDLESATSPATIWGLESAEDYDVTIVGIDESTTPDTIGPGSAISSKKTLTSSFGAKLVDWGPDGVNFSPTTVDNVGTKGSTYNLDTDIPGSGSLSNQTRNGRNVWQVSGDGGLKVSPAPPVSTISQPCTVYIAIQPFFLDGNFRWVMRGGFNDLQIKANNSGWTFTLAPGAGIFNIGNAATDGRLYVLECKVDNTTGSLRVLDSTGADTGTIAGNLSSSAVIRPESMNWDVPATANQTLPAQNYRAFIVNGIPTTAERNALIDAAFGMFDDPEPNIVDFIPEAAQTDPTLDDADYYYNLDENGGDRADTSGNGLTLTRELDVDQTTGVIDSAADFLDIISSTGNRLIHAFNASYDMEKDFTICGWAKFDGIASNKRIIYMGSESTNPALTVLDIKLVSSGPHIRAGLSNGTSIFQVTSQVGGTIPSGEFIFFAFRWNNSTLLAELRLNDQAFVTATLGSLTSINNPGDQSFSLGNAVDNNEALGDGALDEIGGWDILLTDSNIDYLYNNGFGSRPSGGGAAPGIPTAKSLSLSIGLNL